MAKAPKNTKQEAPKADVAPIAEIQSALHSKVIAFCDRIREDATVNLHALAFECMEHGSKTGDLRPLLALQNNLPKSFRKLELARWAQALGPIEWGKKDDKTGACDGIKMAREGSKHFKPWDLKTAKAVPFYDTPEAVKPAGIIDAVKQLMQQNTKYEKLIADPSLPRKDGLTDEQLLAQIAVNKRMIAASAA